MGKVEEDLGENQLMPMIVGKEEVAVFTAGCVSGNQDIMQALWLISNIFRLVSVVCKGKVFP